MIELQRDVEGGSSPTHNGRLDAPVTITEKHDIIHKTGSTYYITTPLEKGRFTPELAYRQHTRKICEIQMTGSADKRAKDKQTDRQILSSQQPTPLPTGMEQLSIYCYFIQ